MWAYGMGATDYEPRSVGITMWNRYPQCGRDPAVYNYTNVTAVALYYVEGNQFRGKTVC